MPLQQKSVCLFPKQLFFLRATCPKTHLILSFSNLAYPLDWESIFKYVGFPAYMKPFAGGGWKNVYRIQNAEDFYQKHSETGQAGNVATGRNCF